MRHATRFPFAGLTALVALCCSPQPGAPAAEPFVDVGDSAAEVDGPSADVAPARGCDPDLELSARGELPRDLDEVSGIARDPRDPDVLWMIEDSGNPRDVVAVGLDGHVRATVQLRDTPNRDWEDLALGPCGDRDCLYVAEIGDNNARRSEIYIYRLALPALDEDATVDTERMAATWPGGARDAEALVVFPDETVVVLSKEPGRARIAGAPFAAGDDPVELTDFGTLSLEPWRPGGLLTAADLADGVLLLRLYSDIVALDVGDDPASIASASGVVLPHERELQGESIAWLARGYATVSEGNTPPIFVAECDDGPR